MNKSNKTIEIGGSSPTNGGEESIGMQAPYRVEVSLEGTCPLLWHRWNNESVEAKSKAKKGSAEKKVTTSNRICGGTRLAKSASPASICGRR